MEAALAPLTENRIPPAPDSARKCLVTGELLPKDELIRFVIGPDQSVIPDLAHNLPGRGLWVTAERAAIETAAKKNLFAKAAKTSAKPAPDLADQVAALLRKRCLDFLGLAKRSGIAVLGQPQVEAALKARKISVLLLADDSSENFENLIDRQERWNSPPLEGGVRGGGARLGQKFQNKEQSSGMPMAPPPNLPLEGGGIPASLAAPIFVTRHFTRNELGAALGHDQLVYVGLEAHSLTGKLRAELMRLEKISAMSHIKHESERIKQ